MVRRYSYTFATAESDELEHLGCGWKAGTNHSNYWLRDVSEGVFLEFQLFHSQCELRTPHSPAKLFHNHANQQLEARKRYLITCWGLRILT